MARTADQKEARLGALALFAGADNKAISHLAAAADEIDVEAGHVIIREGQNHDEVYILESGSAEVHVGDEKVADIPAGEMVGELGYFIHTPASATVMTSSASTLLIIPYNRMEQILDDNPGLVRAIAAELAERLHDMDDRLRNRQD